MESLYGGASSYRLTFAQSGEAPLGGKAEGALGGRVAGKLVDVMRMGKLAAI